MSSFVVSEKCLRRIVSYLDKHGEFIRMDDLQGLGYAEDAGFPEQLMADMLALNCKATGYRYRKTIESPDYTFAPIEPTPVETIKAAQCWLYQCNEGKYDQHKLYRFIDHLVTEWCVNYVMQSPEYNSAPWDND